MGERDTSSEVEMGNAAEIWLVLTPSWSWALELTPLLLQEEYLIAEFSQSTYIGIFWNGKTSFWPAVAFDKPKIVLVQIQVPEQIMNCNNSHYNDKTPMQSFEVATLNEIA